MSTEGWKALKEKVGANSKNRFVWSPSYIDALVTRDRDTDANGTLDERLFAQHDANFHVTAITNTSGTVQERCTPDPFGVVTFRDVSGNTISAKNWVFLHQGGQADILGHYDFRNRILSPTLGRWLTNDPLGFAAGDNNFDRYVANGPGIIVDPFRLEVWHWHHIYPKKIFGAFFGDWVHLPENGIVITDYDHVCEFGLHSSGYNIDWKKWVEDSKKKGLPITKEAEKERYKNEVNPATV